MKVTKSKKTNRKMLIMKSMLLVIALLIVATFGIFVNQQNISNKDEVELAKTMTDKQLEEGEQTEEQGIELQANEQDVEIETTPSFKLTKIDAETGEALPNTKFAIYKVDDEEVPATNSKGELVGTKETIDGTEYNVVTTDENGEITIDLVPGSYKAVEVKASNDKYALADETYFEIEDLEAIKVDWATSVGGTSSDIINAVAETQDGGYIAGGYFNSSSLQVGEYTLTNAGGQDGMLIKYNVNNEVE